MALNERISTQKNGNAHSHKDYGRCESENEMRFVPQGNYIKKVRK